MKKILVLLLMFAFLPACAVTDVTKVKIDYETIFYPPSPQKPRLQFLTHISHEEDIGKKETAFKIFSSASCRSK
jgi:hypothetical protein